MLRPRTRLTIAHPQLPAVLQTTKRRQSMICCIAVTAIIFFFLTANLCSGSKYGTQAGNENITAALPQEDRLQQGQKSIVISGCLGARGKRAESTEATKSS